MRTNSRYDFMKEGNVKDEVSGNYYPDPLSINYLNYFFTEAQETNSAKFPTPIILSSRPDAFKDLIISAYGRPIYDDIVLTLNKYSHVNFVEGGDVIFIPSISSIEKAFK